jgi:hypothetical protein
MATADADTVSGSAVQLSSILELFRAEPEGHAGTVLKKANFIAGSILPGMGDPEFIGEPYLWLHFFLTKKPKRSDLVDELDCPGRYVTAFVNSTSALYGGNASPLEIQELRRFFESISREYFTYHACGGTDAEFRRLMRHVEPLIDGARALIDKWDTAAVTAGVGKQHGEEFARILAASRMHVSKRAQTALASVMRVRGQGSTNNATVTLPKLREQREGASEGTPHLPAPTIVEGKRKRSRSGRSERAAAKLAQAGRGPSVPGVNQLTGGSASPNARKPEGDKNNAPAPVTSQKKQEKKKK